MWIGILLAALCFALALLHRGVHLRAMERDGVGVPGVLFLSMTLLVEGLVWIAVTATIAMSFMQTAGEVFAITVAMGCMGARLLFKLGIYLAMQFTDIPPRGITSWRQAAAFAVLGYAGAAKRLTHPWVRVVVETVRERINGNRDGGRDG